MVGSDFIEIFNKFKVTTYVGLEDFVDRMNFLFTCSFLLLCCTIVTVKTYFMSPLSCFIPTPVSGTGNMDYVSSWCWAEGTYALSVRDMDSISLDPNSKLMQDSKITYYQWVPFMLGIQCVLFYLPRVIWQFFSHNCTGTDLEYLITVANDAVHSDAEKRRKLVEHLTNSLVNVLYQHREYRVNTVTFLKRRLYRFCCILLPSKRLGTKLVNFYVVVKVMYTVNSIGQLYLMHRFLQMDGRYPVFGIELLMKLINGQDWQNSMVFPRRGACAVELKVAAANHMQLAQCALPVNMLNEKLYIFLWFWILTVSVFNIFSLPLWFKRVASVSSQYRFVKKYLKLNGVYKGTGDPEGLRNTIRQFCKAFLRHDGIFMLRMISINAGDVLCADLVLKLWDTFKKTYLRRDFRDDTVVDTSRQTPSQRKRERHPKLPNGQPPSILVDELKAPLLAGKTPPTPPKSTLKVRPSPDNAYTQPPGAQTSQM